MKRLIIEIIFTCFVLLNLLLMVWAKAGGLHPNYKAWFVILVLSGVYCAARWIMVKEAKNIKNLNNK